MVLFALISITGYSQTELPAEVDQAFRNKFSTAKDIQSCKENNLYSIEFILKNDYYTAVFDQSGTWIETARIISDMEVPAPVISAAKKIYPNMFVSFTESVETMNSEKFLRVHGCTEGAEIIVNITKEGKIISTQEKEYIKKTAE